MTISQYIRFVVDKIEVAEADEDLAEVARLLRLISKVALENAAKIDGAPS